MVVHNTSPLLLNVNFNLVKESSSPISIPTHSELEVIGGGLGELLAARAGRTTPLPVPQWVVCVQYSCRNGRDCRVTEVVFPDEWWHGSSIGLICASAWTYIAVAVELCGC